MKSYDSILFQNDTELKFSNWLDLLDYRATYQSEQTAYFFSQHQSTEAITLTYAELGIQARAIAAKLQSYDSLGQRAVLLYQPGLEFVAAFFGCLYAGVVAIPVYPTRRHQKFSQLQGILVDAQAKLILTSNSLIEQIKRQLEEHELLESVQCLATDEINSEESSQWQKPAIDENTLAFLQYTSGSTGTPKGVKISHGNLMHNSSWIYQKFGHNSDSRGVIWLPLYHDMGLIGGVLQPLYGGFPVMLMSPMNFLQKPLRWLQAISDFKATTSGGPDFAYDLCVRKVTPEQIANLDLSSWSIAFTGAEPVRAETLDRFARVFEPCGFRKEAFYPCYGMAEATLLVSGGIKEQPSVICRVNSTALEQNQVVIAEAKHQQVREIVSCGQTIPDQKILIVNPQTLTECLPEEVGEIWIAGASVTQGYWNREKENNQVVNAYLADTGEGPYLRTGDLGFLRDQELFVTGRIKDVIIIRGQNHYPQDIEQTVEKCHPALKAGSGAAFAAEIKGQERLVIVQEVERSYLKKLNVNEIAGNIRQAVTANHDLQVYATVLIKTGSIPKTSSGKVKRRACCNGFLEGTLNVVEDWSENPKNKTKFLHLQADIESVLQQIKSARVTNEVAE